MDDDDLTVLVKLGNVSSYVLAYFGLVLDTSCLIFLLNEFRYPKSPLRSSYFVILTFGLVMIISVLVVRILFLYDSAFIQGVPKEAIASVFEWIPANTIGIWIFVLACNRCTALIIPAYHTKVHFIFIVICKPLVL